MKKLVIAFVFLMVFFISLASATFSVGNHSLQKSYAPGGIISGWLNISFDDELSTSIFTGSYGGQIELKKLLDKNKDFVYSCVPQNCKEDYSAEDGETTLTFDLTEDEEKIIGFKFTKNIDK